MAALAAAIAAMAGTLANSRRCIECGARLTAGEDELCEFCEDAAEDEAD